MDITEKRITQRHLNEGELSGVNYYNCIFERIQLDNFKFRDCEFEKCHFVNCSIKNLKLNFFKLIDCEFKDCLLQGVNAADIMFPCTFSLVSCDLRFVDFIGLRLQKSIFLSSRFRDCLFEETDLRKSDFTGSAFNNTEFRHSDLSHCDFSMTEGLDINPEINRILSIKIPQEAGLKILKRMGVVVGG
ncbi:pentapeptide repeat-containing protein [Escherichia coli]|uniref:pentapeptide repeat-containing protein n=1 Tax=Escherichia coli TaxID=562 RepID=UPI002AC739EB|nr:pentapeptide repeat-containing protein [Escherichia coli]MDZ4888760.1 pentapeptide repeat-containing protein [Escherichia coli]MDZ4953925.1 pentapeptide repeat-containing protein [Escherichia coli]MDZ4988312.1 pentapeptide repeat-containing protein [Escherichia coli]